MLRRLLFGLIAWVAPRAWRDSVIGDLDEQSASGRGSPVPLRELIGILARFSLDRCRPRAAGETMSSLIRSAAASLVALARDLRLAVRSLSSQPGTTFVAVVSLAVAIGASTAGFSIIDRTVVRPVRGVGDSDRLVAVRGGRVDRPGESISYPDLVDYRAAAAPIEAVSAYVTTEATLGEAPDVERIDLQVVTADFFSTLGAPPTLGRAFRDGEDAPGSTPVAVVSHRFWTNRLGGSAGALGATVRVNGQAFAVVGVAAPGFRGVRLDRAPDVWVTAAHAGLALPQFGDDVLTQRGWAVWRVVARMRPDAVPGAVQDGLAAVAAALDREYPEPSARAVSVVPLQGAALGSTHRESVVTYASLGVGVLVLLLAAACLNVGMLLVARGVARQRELAVRIALGASRAAVLRQLAAEGLLLTGLAAAAGVLVVAWALPAGAALEVPVPVVVDLAVDARDLAFAAALAMFVGLMVSLWPAVGLSRPDLLQATRHDADARPATGRLAPRRLLLGGQVALSALLLISAGLLVRTLATLQDMNPGFDPERLAAVRLDPEQSGLDRDAAVAQLRALADSVAAHPGIDRVTLSSDLPLRPEDSGMVVFADDEREIAVSVNLAGRGYFHTLGIPIVEGRSLEDHEWAEGDAVVISEATARQLWPGESAVGRLITTRRGGPPWRVVGVAGDVRSETLRAPDETLMYMPYPRVPRLFSSGMYLAARIGAGADETTLVRAIAASPAAMPVLDRIQMSDELARALAPERQSAVAVTAVAVLAFGLAVLGVFGLSAFTIARRTRELGLRVALGATRGRIIRLVLGDSLVPIAVGLAVGIAASLSLAGLIESRLYGVAATDPVTIAAVAAVVLVAGAVASLLPLGRAGRLEVVRVLRE